MNLPQHLEEMALFAVNTGCRDNEICNLRREWETKVPELGLPVLTIPGSHVKNGRERLVVLNGIAESVVMASRGQHTTHVFAFQQQNSAWLKARKRAGLPQVRVKHTFGRRLRAAGVSFENRQDSPGHVPGRITTHYSAAELSRLIYAANTVCEADGRRPELVIVRGTFPQLGARKTPAREYLRLKEVV